MLPANKNLSPAFTPASATATRQKPLVSQPPLIQAKLTIGQPNDPYEQEADRVADTVMRMPDPKVQRQSDEKEKEDDDEKVVQTKPIAGQITPLVQTQAVPNHTPEVTPAAEANINAMKGGGRPLDSTTRAFMEPRFGHNFSQVRVHTDAQAAESAKGVNALAYTTGQDIVFKAGRYAPDSQAGRNLIAHELTHVVQQSGTVARKPTVQRDLEKSQKDTQSGARGSSTVIQAKTEEKKAGSDGEDVLKQMLQEIEQAKSGASSESAGKAGSPVKPGQNTKQPVEPKAEQQAKSNIAPAGLANEKAGLSLQVKPVVQHVAEQKTDVEKKANELKASVGEPAEPLIEPPAEAEPPDTAQEAPEQEDTEDPAAGLDQAKEMFAQAEAQPLPEAPAPVAPPMPVIPLDAGGKPLPGNPQLDMQVANLAARAQTLRAKGTSLRVQAAQERANAAIIQGNIAVAQSGVARAEAGIAKVQDNVAYRRQVVGQSKAALEVSEQKAEMVATEAPKYAAKSEEDKAKSGPMAGEAKDLAAQNTAHQPGDNEVAGKSQEQGAKLNKVATDLGSIDDAVMQTKARAESLGQEAAEAKQTNQQTQGKVAATEATLAQTEKHTEQMKKQSAAAQAHIAGVVDGPAQIKSEADALDQQGLAAIQASVEIEKRLQQAQQNYQQGASSVPAAKMAARRQSGGPMGVQPKEDEGAYAGRINLNLGGRVSEALPSWLTGEEPQSAEQRQQAQQKEQERREAEINEINAGADKGFQSLNAAEKAGIALSLTTRNIFHSVGETNWPDFAKQLVLGMVDPRVSLMGIVSGLSMTLSGVANLFSGEQWAKDPLGNLLKSAADIATGIAITLGAIAGLAMAIIVVLTAAAIVTLGFLGPLAAFLIPFCATVAATVGGWTITAAAIAAGLQGYVLIKSLISAATASSAKELQTRSDEMTEDAKNMGNMAMQVGLAKLMEAGGKKLGETKFGQAVGETSQSIGKSVGEEFGIIKPAKGAPTRVVSEPNAGGGAKPVEASSTPKAGKVAEPVEVTSGHKPAKPVKDVKETSTSKETDPIKEPTKPTGPKPDINEPGAAEWRYERYSRNKSLEGKKPLDFDTWKQRYFDTAVTGGRPGRPGGPEQVTAKNALKEMENIRPVEHIKLGGRYPDGIKQNALGGTDYYEVGKMLKNRLPEMRERIKLADEIKALGPNDTVTFVDKTNISQRITYRPGNDVHTKTPSD